MFSCSVTQTPDVLGCHATLALLCAWTVVCVFTCAPIPQCARYECVCYLVTREDESDPYKKARDRLCCGSHEEDGLRVQPWGLWEPWNVRPRWSCRGWECGGCSGGRIFSQPLWERHVSPPQPQHLEVTQRLSIGETTGTKKLYMFMCKHTVTAESQTITMKWINWLTPTIFNLKHRSHPVLSLLPDFSKDRKSNRSSSSLRVNISSQVKNLSVSVFVCVRHY